MVEIIQGKREKQRDFSFFFFGGGGGGGGGWGNRCSDVVIPKDYDYKAIAKGKEGRS